MFSAFPYTVEFCISIVKKIRSPIIRMLTGSRLLSKFTRDFQTISIRKIFENIQNEVWMNYEETQINVSEQSVTDKYPLYDPKQHKKVSKHLNMNRNEYLTLLLLLFESYVEVYRIHDLLEMLLSGDVIPNKPNNELYRQEQKKGINEKRHRFDFVKLLKDWKYLNTASKECASTDMILLPKLIECQHLYVNLSLCLRCQEDLEYIIHLQEIIDQNSKVGDTFKEWRISIEKYLSPCIERLT